MEHSLTRLRVRNLLSFGDKGIDLELKPLNVFIGANGSGKSNLIEILALLRSLPSDMTSVIRSGGGIHDWIWKGKQKQIAELDITVQPLHEGDIPIHHKICFADKGQTYEITDESIENTKQLYHDRDDVQYFYRYRDGDPAISSMEDGARKLRFFNKGEAVDMKQSILQQRKDPTSYPELAYLSDLYGGIKIFREWGFGRSSIPRLPQKTDLPEDFLLESVENLGLVLNEIDHMTGGRALIHHYMKQLFESFEDYSVRIHSSTVQVHITEKGLLSPIPATRLSDGTLRYLCLLAILCHPNPPKVICIEEPELGLHPDMIGQIAELSVEASKKTQLFITTHSEIFIDALSNNSDSVVVCEKHTGETIMHRESRDVIDEWRKNNYSLGQLWRKGEIGGNRW